MDVFLTLNGYILDAGVDEQERVMLALASSSREELLTWLEKHARPVEDHA